MSKLSLHLILALIATASVLATPAAAKFLGDLGLFGGGLFFPEAQQCLNGIFSVRGCLHELLFSVLTLQPRLLGPTCCTAVLQIDDSCWPKMIPLDSAFPSSLKNFCLASAPPPPPPCSSGDVSVSHEGGDCDDA